MPKYKLTEDGKAIEMKDGKPVVVDDDGKEYAVDAIGANEKVRQFMAEAKDYRLKAKEAKEALAPFQKFIDEGIDPAKALEAVATVSSLDDKIKADMEALKKQLNETWEAKLAEKEEALKNMEQNLYKANVTKSFATSPVVKKLILPPDIAAEYFGKHFKPDGTAVDEAGNVIYSKEKPGEPAAFDEALEILIDNYPNKESILKGSGTNGGGATGGSGGAPAQNLTPREKIAAGLKARR